MIDLDKLLNYRMPEVRQVLTPKGAALYALSVGLGQDPTDRHQLDYVDHRRQAFRAVPSQALVLAPPPGFWTLAEETGLNAEQLVHGEQGMTLHRPLPVEGEVVSRTRLDGVVDKGAGKGALLYTTRELFDAATDELIATAQSTTFLRADGGFGGPDGPVRAPAPIPDTPPDRTIDLPTRPEQALYYRLNGDENPIHSDPDVAAKAGFAMPILHGLCTFGIACRGLLATMCGYDAARLRSMRLRFTAPVLPGETIRLEVWDTGAFRARIVERDLIAANNGAFELA